MMGRTLGVFKIQPEDLLLTPKNPDGLLELNIPVQKNNMTMCHAKVLISVSTYMTPEEEERIRVIKSKMVQVHIYTPTPLAYLPTFTCVHHTCTHTLIYTYNHTIMQLYKHIYTQP